MQNNEQKKKRTKGFYILLAVCVLAIGVSGYYFLSDASTEQQELNQSLSVPPRAQMDEQQSQPQQEQAQTDESKAQTAAGQAVLEQAVMPVAGDVLRAYSMQALAYDATTKDWRTHGGVDLAAQPGQSVCAAKSGTVLSVYEDAYYGMTVVLQHEDGYTTTYCGLGTEVPVHAAQVVHAGEVIGTVGDTALIETALDSHLHFEVSKDGVRVDPASFLYQ